MGMVKLYAFFGLIVLLGLLILTGCSGGITNSSGEQPINYDDGSSPVNEAKDDRANGHVSYTEPSGNKYVGETKDNMAHGQGTYTYVDGRQYVGEFKNDMLHGHGTFTAADGTVLTGKWANDEHVGP